MSLFKDQLFGQIGDPKAMTAKPLLFDYAPPKECGKTWSKVVLEVDFSVPAGRQYDRTAGIWLGGTNLYFGTTQEPDATSGARWHVERDLTDYAPLFRDPKPGQVILNNWVSEKYTSVIQASAHLVFYPATQDAPASTAADAVFGLSDDPRGEQAIVQDGKARLHRTLALPRNTERVYMDVFAQSQGNDEPWYTCIDDAYVSKTQTFALESPYDGAPLQECNGGNLRQVLVTIDGQPAGLAPVFPWTYTGGVNPHLWRPMPDIQTLNFIPYRVDLTPFAALLDDGKPHDVSVHVLGANRFFNLAASLLVYEDQGSKVLAGKLLSNSLKKQPGTGLPHVESTLHANGEHRIEGTVNTAGKDSYLIVGVLDTSHGKVRTEVAHKDSFSNRQTFSRPDATHYRQVIDQATDVDETIATRTGNAAEVRHRRTVSYPLHLDVTKDVAQDGSFQGDIDMSQGLHVIRQSRGGDVAFESHLDESIQSHAAADFNSMGSSINHSRDQHAMHTFAFKDTFGSCSATKLESRNEEPAVATPGEGCPNGTGALDWRSRLDAQASGVP
ncbi:peptide-N4-asparagine amidase [Luteibacter sp.]|uniref:peptide-N4-asparagine amidase n=1 Tax=Luteibacter sp. TaxID=1886636 RepID=UPI002F3FC936